MRVFSLATIFLLFLIGFAAYISSSEFFFSNASTVVASGFSSKTLESFPQGWTYGDRSAGHSSEWNAGVWRYSSDNAMELNLNWFNESRFSDGDPQVNGLKSVFAPVEQNAVYELSFYSKPLIECDCSAWVQVIAFEKENGFDTEAFDLYYDNTRITDSTMDNASFADVGDGWKKVTAFVSFKNPSTKIAQVHFMADFNALPVKGRVLVKDVVLARSE